MNSDTSEIVYTIDELNEPIKPLPRPTRTFNCGFSYLETWLQNESSAIEKGIDLNPDFQRGHVWNEQQQLSCIKKVFRRVVDDWQRLNAIRRFVKGDLKFFLVSTAVEHRTVNMSSTLLRRC